MAVGVFASGWDESVCSGRKRSHVLDVEQKDCFELTKLTRREQEEVLNFIKRCRKRDFSTIS